MIVCVGVVHRLKLLREMLKAAGACVPVLVKSCTGDEQAGKRESQLYGASCDKIDKP